MSRNETIVCCLSLCILSGCGGGSPTLDPKISPAVASLLKDAEVFELYSLNPYSKLTPGTKSFQGWAILGKTVVKDSAVRDKLITAFNDGVRNHDGVVLYNFIPRHGIRLIPKGQSVDVVISYECHLVRVYIGGKKEGKDITITEAPEPVFDEVLRAAGVALAKKPER